MVFGRLGIAAMMAWVSLSACSAEVERPCGDFKCTSDELCVRQQSLIETFACVKNPCGDKPVDCACAASACMAPFECGSAHDDEVQCFCERC